MVDDPDVGEAVDYIRAERPKLAEDDVWRVLLELGTPPTERADGIALDLLGTTQPHIRRRDARVILREWRAYSGLAETDDWPDD